MSPCHVLEAPPGVFLIESVMIRTPPHTHTHTLPGAVDKDEDEGHECDEIIPELNAGLLAPLPPDE